MPLSKLFHKRTSLKNQKEVEKATQVSTLSESKEPKQEAPSSCTDGGGPSEVVSTSEVPLSADLEYTEGVCEVKMEESNLPDDQQDPNRRKSSASSEDSQHDALPQKASISKGSRSRNRSSSCKVSGTSSRTSSFKGGRRKCDSESGVFNSSTDDEGFDDKVIHLREKDLESVIGQCVDRLIRESIVTAVKSVNLDNLYEEVMKDISERRQSGSSESADTVEQKLHSEDVTEYVDLEMDAEFDGDLLPDCDTNDYSSASENSANGGEDKDISSDVPSILPLDTYVSEATEIKYLSSDGYQADIEETGSCQSMPLESSSDDLKALKAIEAEVATPGHTAGKEDESKQVESGDMEESSSEFIEGRERNETLKAEENEDLILMAIEEDSESRLTTERESSADELSSSANDLGENLPEQHPSTDEEKKVNWKMGYLQVKLPHKTRSKGHLKVWKKRCVAIQPDEFVNDPDNPCLMISVYSAESGAARKHSATFWKSVSGKKAVVYRCNSRTHRYAFTISDDNKAVVHLAADSEVATQEWMAAIRAILWPPSPVMQLEKMLNGSVFEISLIDNDFSYRAGLLGMYGYLTITPKKLILVHPQQGYVIQEWYLNTVDKFQLMPQTKIEDVHKVLSMTTCSDSSTGNGEILIFCSEGVALLQSLASTIHQILTYHSTQEGGIYQKELEEIAEWLTAPQTSDSKGTSEDYYKVPPRQVKSLLDIPNFIFDKVLTPVASVTCGPGVAMDAVKPTLEDARTNPITVSRDSGISAGNAADDFLNCSVTSFVVGGGPFTGKSSDSEFSDAYTPPHSPVMKAKDTGATDSKPPVPETAANA